MSALEAVHAADTMDPLQSLDQNHLNMNAYIGQGLTIDQLVIVQTESVVRSKQPCATP